MVERWLPGTSAGQEGLVLFRGCLIMLCLHPIQKIMRFASEWLHAGCINCKRDMQLNPVPQHALRFSFMQLLHQMVCKALEKVALWADEINRLCHSNQHVVGIEVSVLLVVMWTIL